MTDTVATRPYGVLGRVLGHSYTPTIYKELAGLEVRAILSASPRISRLL